MALETTTLVVSSARLPAAWPMWTVAPRARRDAAVSDSRASLPATRHYRAEGTPLREAARTAEDRVPRLDMRRARWDGRDGSGGDGSGGD
ncbi:hypothetical protein ABZ509_35840, partial [Streptomyces lavendulocolor]